MGRKWLFVQRPLPLEFAGGKQIEIAFAKSSAALSQPGAEIKNFACGSHS
jgi:hypothetical protein